jgi:hypothetical protein
MQNPVPTAGQAPSKASALQWRQSGTGGLLRPLDLEQMPESQEERGPV